MQIFMTDLFMDGNFPIYLQSKLFLPVRMFKMSRPMLVNVFPSLYGILPLKSGEFAPRTPNRPSSLHPEAPKDSTLPFLGSKLSPARKKGKQFSISFRTIAGSSVSSHSIQLNKWSSLRVVVVVTIHSCLSALLVG